MKKLLWKLTVVSSMHWCLFLCVCEFLACGVSHVVNFVPRPNTKIIRSLQQSNQTKNNTYCFGWKNTSNCQNTSHSTYWLLWHLLAVAAGYMKLDHWTILSFKQLTSRSHPHIYWIMFCSTNRIDSLSHNLALDDGSQWIISCAVRFVVLYCWVLKKEFNRKKNKKKEKARHVTACI